MRVFYSLIIIFLISANLWFVREPATISKVVVVGNHARITDVYGQKAKLDGNIVDVDYFSPTYHKYGFVGPLWSDRERLDIKFLYIFEERTDGKLYAVGAVEINPVPAEIREDLIKLLTGKSLVNG